MAIQVDMPEEIKEGGGNFLRAPGRYHFAVIETDESPMTHQKPPQPFDGFRIEAAVLCGPEKGKQHEFDFRTPMPTWSEKGIEMGRKKIAACMVATGFAGPENMGKGMTVELKQCVGRQFFAEVDFEKDEDGNDKVSENGKKFLQLAWSNIYHVDDPMAKDFSLDDKALALLPKAHRITDASFFDRIRGKGKSASGSNGSAAKTEPKRETVAASSGVSSDLGDL